MKAAAPKSKAARPKVAKAAKPGPVAQLALPASWEAVTAIVALGDGRVLAGSAQGVALYRPDGSLGWEAVLAVNEPISSITVGGDQIAAHAADESTLFLLDSETGAVRGTHTTRSTSR